MKYCVANSNKSISTPLLLRNISNCTKILFSGVIAGCISILTAQFAQALTFNESGDAGQTLGTAQNIGGAIDQINGNITAGDVDLYQFFLGSNATFTASTGGLAGGNDTELFLFDATGAGVTADDDGVSFAGESTINTSLTAGTYYLGIGEFDTTAVDGDGTNWGSDTPPVDFSTLDSFTATGSSSFSYGISLSPATSSASVPFEFSPGLGLLLVGAGFGLKRGWKQVNRQKVSFD
ncbi:MAG: DVUA0089 family protein [Xenococcaceae cyanobacterium]